MPRGSKPDEATQIAFGRALSAEAGGAEEWHSWWSNKPGAPSPTLTADIVRQIASAKFPGKVDMYRLILTCRVDTHEGEIKLAWANGVPEEGQPMTVAVDGNFRFTHRAEGGKKQGNGANGPGATILYPDPDMRLPLPLQTLTISNLFPNILVISICPAAQGPFLRQRLRRRHSLPLRFGFGKLDSGRVRVRGI
jgi:hypothetical protein